MQHMKNVFETKLIYKTLLKTEFLQASMSLQGNHKHAMKITTRNDNLLLPVPLLPRRSPQEYLGFSVHSKVIAPSVLFGTAALIWRGEKKKEKRLAGVSHSTKIHWWWVPERLGEPVPPPAARPSPTSPTQDPVVHRKSEGVPVICLTTHLNCKSTNVLDFLLFLLTSADGLWAVAVSLIFLWKSFLLYCTEGKDNCIRDSPLPSQNNFPSLHQVYV